jgi:hypothetical protein
LYGFKKKGFEEMRRLKQVLAVILGTTMVFGSTLTAFATDPTPVNGEDASTAGTGQVLDFKKVSQVVPTALKVAINPNGYDVNLRYVAVATGTAFDGDVKYYTKGSDGTYSVDTGVTATNIANKISAGLYTAVTSDDQIVTFNYGLANKSTVARKITVKLDVTADEKIEFVSSADAAKSKTETGGAAERGEYKIYLELVPAKVGTTPTTPTYAKSTAFADANTEYYTWDDTNKKYLGPAKYADADAYAAVDGDKFTATTTIGTEIKASELGDITMEASTAPIAFAAKADAGTAFADVAYSLPKSTWTLKADQYIDFDTTAAQVADKFEMTGIGGLSGFTISGTMNKNAEWSQLTTKTITITPTYAIVDATGEEEAVTTGLNQVKAEARVPANAAPSIATTTYTAAADTAIDITVNLGSGDKKATGIASVTYKNKSGVDVAVESGTGYEFANGKVTLTAATINAFVSATATTREYTITFDDTDSTAVVITVNK